MLDVRIALGLVCDGVMSVPTWVAAACEEDKGKVFFLLSSVLWKKMGVFHPILQGTVHAGCLFHLEICLG